MSTSAAVKIIDTSSNHDRSENVVYLYHHSDGYPSYMVPVIKKAYQRYAKIRPTGVNEKGSHSYYRAYGDKFNAYKGARAGYVAGFLCGEDPGMMQPEECEFAGRGQYDWFYTLWVTEGHRQERNSAENIAKGGPRSYLAAGSPIWELEIRSGGPDGAVHQPRDALSHARPSDTYRYDPGGSMRE